MLVTHFESLLGFSSMDIDMPKKLCAEVLSSPEEVLSWCVLAGEQRTRILPFMMRLEAVRMVMMTAGHRLPAGMSLIEKLQLPVHRGGVHDCVSLLHFTVRGQCPCLLQGASKCQVPHRSCGEEAAGD